MRYIITLLCCTLTILSLSAQEQKPLILNKIIAQVGSEYILYTDLQELNSYARRQQPSIQDDIQCEIMDQLVSKALLLDQARLDSIVISNVELEASLQQRMDYVIAQVGGDEQRFIDIYGITPREQRESMREPLREEMIQQRIQAQLLQAVEITPSEVVEFYESIPTDSLPYLNAEVEIGEIVMKTQISEDIKEAAREKIERVRSRIVDDGEDFAELASIFSDDPGSARVGGDLGWKKRGTYVPEFEAAAYNLEIDEISEVIETQFGYHFIQLLGRRGNNIHVRHVLIRPEITEKDVARTKSILDSVAHAINVDSIPFDLAVRLYSDKEVRSYNNAGRLINDLTGDTFWETADLTPPAIYFAIEDLEVGQMSEVLEMEERGDKIFKIIQLQSKRRPHQASLTTDFARLEGMAKESKKADYFNEWMEKKIKSTSIQIQKEFATCPTLEKYNVSQL